MWDAALQDRRPGRRCRCGSPRDPTCRVELTDFGEPGPEQIWQETVERLLFPLKSNAGGLTTVEATTRLMLCGANDAGNVKCIPLWRQFLRRFGNPLVIIVLIASPVSAISGGVASFVVIVFIIPISVILDSVQDFRAQNAVASLRASVSVQATQGATAKWCRSRSPSWQGHSCGDRASFPALGRWRVVRLRADAAPVLRLSGDHNRRQSRNRRAYQGRLLSLSTGKTFSRRKRGLPLSHPL